MKRLVMAILATVVGLNVYAVDVPRSKPAASAKKPSSADCPDKAPGKTAVTAAAAATAGATAAAEPKLDAAAAQALAQKHACMACHQADKKVVGPSLKDIAAKYRGDTNAEAALAKKVKEGGAGNWGAVPMPPHPQVSDADIKTLVVWILGIK